MFAELVKKVIGGPSDFGIGWLLILVSSVITIIVSVVAFFQWVVPKLYRKKHALKIVSLLDTHTHISHFSSLLGNPVYINTIGNKIVGNQEYIFLHYYFYAQAITDSNGSVLLFSITTRRKKFCPILRDQFGSTIVQLGKTRFDQSGDPQSTYQGQDHGAITFYSELHYFGLEGDYRYYSFSLNPNGYRKMSNIPLSFTEDGAQNPTEIAQFRATNIINTYTVGGSEDYIEIGGAGFLGPRHYQIRVFK